MNRVAIRVLRGLCFFGVVATGALAIPTAAHAQVFQSTPGLPVISGNPAAEDTITVTGGPANIVSMRVELDITHTWTGDLDIILSPPAALGLGDIDLFTRHGGDQEDIVDAFFTGSADPVYNPAGAIAVAIAGAPGDPYTGTFTPVDVAIFDTLYGVAADGDWTLSVGDTIGGDDGTLVGWSIEFTTLSDEYILTATGDTRTRSVPVGANRVVAQFVFNTLEAATLGAATVSFTGNGATGDQLTNLRMVLDAGLPGIFEPGTDTVLATAADFSTGSAAFDVDPDPALLDGITLLVVADVAALSGTSFFLSIEDAADVVASSNPASVTTFPVSGRQNRVVEAAVIAPDSSFVQSFDGGPANFELVVDGTFPVATTATSLILAGTATPPNAARVVQINQDHPAGTATRPLSGDGQIVIDYPNGDAIGAVDLIYDMSALSKATDQVTLGFKWWDSGSEDNDGDIVALSVDGGATWAAVLFNWPATRTPIQRWRYASVDLTAVMNTLPGDFTDQMLIRFQEEDNFVFASDGLGLDDIAIIATRTPQSAALTVREVRSNGPEATHDAPAAGSNRDFRGVLSGNTSPALELYIRNEGLGPLTLSAPTLQGADFDVFNLSRDTNATTAFPMTLYDGGCLILEASFEPVSGIAGLRRAEIHIEHDSPDFPSPFIVHIEGREETEATRLIEVRQDSVNGPLLSSGGDLSEFGAFGVVDGNSPASTIVVTNRGNATATLQNPTVAGVGAHGFILDISAFRTFLDPGESTTFDVLFNPAVTGPHLARLSIPHDATDSASPFTLNLDGTGIAPPLAQVFGSTPALAVSDAAPATDVITVAGGPAAIESLELELTVTHNDISELSAVLTSPGGMQITLVNRRGFLSRNLAHTTFTGSADVLRNADSSAPSATSIGTGGSTARFVPEGVTEWDSLYGTDPAGDWTLEITDFVGGNDGVLDGWSLQFDTQVSCAGLVSYEFDGDVATPLFSHPELGAAPLSTLTGILTFPAGNPGDSASSRDFLTFGDNYHEILLSPDPNRVLRLQSLTFDLRSSSTGPDQYTVRVLNNGEDTGFDPGFQATTFSPDWSTVTVDFTGLAASALEGPVALRVMAQRTSGGSNAGTLRLDNVCVSGTVAVAPQAAITLERPAGLPLLDEGFDVLGSDLTSGEENAFTYRVLNAGDADLVISDVSFTGATNASARVETVLPLTVAAGGQGQLEIRVEPTVDGAFSLSMGVTSNAPGSLTSYDLALSGTGINGRPDIALEDAGGQSVPDDSDSAVGDLQVSQATTLVYTIQNTGAGTLTVSGASTDAANNTAAVAISATPFTVPAGGEADLEIEVTPTFDGPFSFDLQIASDAPGDRALFDIAVDGAGVGGVPDISLARPAGSPLIDTDIDGLGALATEAANPITYTVVNTGTSTLNITALAFPSTTNCSVEGTAGVPAAIAPGTDGSFSIEVTPTRDGAFSFDLEVVSDAPGVRGVYDITAIGRGEGGTPLLELSRGGTAVADDGTDDIGANATSQANTVTYLLTNAGTAALDLTQISFSEQDNCTVAPNIGVPFVVPPGGVSAVAVDVTPTVDGPFSFRLALTSNAAPDADNYVVDISGTGIGGVPDVLIEAPSGEAVLDGGVDALGDRSSGQAVILPFTLRSTGAGALRLLNVRFPNKVNCEVSVEGALPGPIAPGTTAVVNVSLVPGIDGAFSFDIAFDTDAPGDVADYAINLHGVGVGGAPKIELGRGEAVFRGGETDRVEDPAGTGEVNTLSYRIANPGTADLGVTAIIFPESNNVTVALNAGLPVVIPAGGTSDLVLDLTPVIDGELSFSLALENDATGGGTPFLLDVSGSATGGVPSIALQTAGGADIADGGTDAIGDQQTSAPRTVGYSVVNPGTGALTVSDVAFSNLSNCQVRGLSGVPATVLAGESSALEIEVTPTFDGAFSFDVAITNDAPGALSSYAATVTGSGVGGVADIELARGTTAIADGGADALGDLESGSAARVDYSVSNTGTTDLVITAVDISGSVNVEVESLNGLPLTVAPGESATVAFDVTAQIDGAFSFDFSLASNAPADRDAYEVHASGAGTGGVPGIELRDGAGTILNGADLDLGDLTTQVEFVRPFSIVNTGLAPLVLQPLQLSEGVNVALEPGGNLSALAPGASLDFQVGVTPIFDGAVSFTLTVGSNVPGDDGSYVVSVTGTGVGGVPEIEVSRPATLPLANGSSDDVGILLPAAAETFTYTVANTGFGPLTVTAVTAGVEQNCGAAVATALPLTVEPASDASLDIEITAGINGAFRCEFTIESELRSEDANYVIAAFGEAAGGLPAIEVLNPAEEALTDGGTDARGERQTAEASAFVYTLVNTGAGDLNVLGLEASNFTNCEVQGDGNLPRRIAPGDRWELSLDVTPIFDGAFGFDLRIDNDVADDTAAFELAVEGEGIGGTPDLEVRRGQSVIADGGAAELGNLVTAEANALSYTLANTGTSELSVSAVTFLNEENVTPTLVSELPITVAPGTTETLSFELTPTIDGFFSVGLAIDSDASAPRDRYAIDLSGDATGGVPTIALARPAGTAIADDGSDDLGEEGTSAQAELSYTIFNDGTGALTVDAVSVSGEQNCDVALLGGLPITLPPGGQGVFELGVTPRIDGDFAFAFDLLSDAPSPADVYTVGVTGTATGGVPSIVIVGPSGALLADGGSDVLAAQTTGEPTAALLRVSNPGTAVLSVDAINIVSTKNCEVTPPEALPQSVAPGEAITVTVMSTATIDGAFSFEAAVMSNVEGPLSPFSLTLFGEASGGVPSIELQRPADTVIADGGADAVGELATGLANAVVYRVINPGTALLTISELSVTASDNVEASLRDGLPVSLAPGGGALFTVDLTPTLDGAFSLDAVVLSDAEGDLASYELSISGTATGGVPIIGVERPVDVQIADGGADDAGDLTTGSPAALVYVLRNTGTASLEVSDLRVIGVQNASVDVVSGVPSSVAPGESGELGITVTPTLDGPLEFDLALVSNAAGETNVFDIGVSGTGIDGVPEIELQRPDGSALASGASEELGEQLGGVAVDLDFLVQNQGTGALSIESITIGDTTNASAAVNAGGGATSVEPGSKHSFSVSVTPEADGAFEAIITITSDDADEGSTTLALKGSGVVPVPQIAVTRNERAVASGSSDELGQLVAGQATFLSYVIQNTGTGELTVSDVTFNGLTNLAAPNIVGAASSPVPPGGFTHVTFSVTPTIEGPVSVELHIASDDPTTPDFVVTLSGVAAKAPSSGGGGSCHSAGAAGGNHMLTALLLGAVLLRRRRRRS